MTDDERDEPGPPAPDTDGPDRDRGTVDTATPGSPPPADDEPTTNATVPHGTTDSHTDDAEPAGTASADGGTPVTGGRATMSGDDHARIRHDHVRRKFGYLRAYFLARADRHADLKRSLDQAHVGETFDVYLARSVRFSLAAFLGGAAIGIVVALLLTPLGALGDLSAPWLPGSFGALSPVIGWIAANEVLVGAVVLAGLLGTLFAAATWLTRYYYPRLVVDSRRRNINITLPHAIVYMYALSFGGMDFVEVLRRTAETGDTYGEVGTEVQVIMRDVDLFGSDLYTALRNARNRTPSKSMEQFLDDMLTMLDSGGQVTEFLHGEADKQREEAVREQERFLDTLELLSEVFIIGFVAAPIFFIVTLLMMSFLGQNTLPMLFAIMYGVLPLGMGLFLVLVATLSEPYRQPDHDLGTPRGAPDPWPDGGVRRYPQFRSFRRIRVRERVASILRDPTAVFRRDPLNTLLVTVPLAVALAALLWVRLDVTPMAFYARSFEVGTAVLVAPFLVIAVPLMAFHELEQHRKRHVAKRLPDMLDILARANQMGLSLGEGLEMVSRNVSGTFADELAKVRNDIEWNGDVHAALLALADRLQVPQLSRTCNILAEGTRSTGDLHKILSIAATDTRQRYRLERNRTHELQAYTTIVLVGFLVYLTVIVVLDVSFLATIAEQVAGSDGIVEAGLVAFSGDTVGIYRALLFHSALIQGVGTGLISGKLTDNSVRSGLKYSILLVVLTVVVFSAL